MTDKKKSQTQAHIDIIRSKTEEPKKVLIVIHGGCAYLNEKPLSVEVEIRDYDVINIDAIDDDRCKKDEDGDWYQEMLFPATKIHFSANGDQCFTDVVEKSVLKHIIILLHDISYYLDEDELFTIEVGDCEYEHIHYMITEGMKEGELNKTDPKDENKTIRGYWRMV